MPLARDVARSLIEAGFTLHHCDQQDLLYRLGGACLMPIPGEAGHRGIAVSWTTHNLLLLDWDRYGIYSRTLQLMNAALGGVLHGFGYRVQELGTGGAWLVSSRRDRRRERDDDGARDGHPDHRPLLTQATATRSTVSSAFQRRWQCWPWRAWPRTSRTGMRTRSSGRTARAESPPGWNPRRSTGWSMQSSMVVLYAARHRLPAPPLARWLLGLGIAATLTANMAQGWSHGPVGAAVAAWPAVSLVGSYELLVWLIRTAGALERGPPPEANSNSAVLPGSPAPCPPLGRRQAAQPERA